MTAYALGSFRDIVPAAAGTGPHPDIIAYVERIQATLDPFGGRFLVHGAEVEVMEGTWPGNMVLIGFPGPAEARAWYASPAYQAIVPLRTDHVEGVIILVDGVAPGYDPAELAAKMRAAGAGGAAGS
ncbi:DUF1330 domain-containing protein [Streptomyces roseoverticillatus]|uniref:DUF1330 domain-containing protein n=1 Tax=Streptomyces roseoverticillatus TaxID=66429 RepID=UPI001F1D2AA2|nr:DUF1330 domain-containing protein [Streptomyces roseoverticillatus]MCF3105586.1 DUF1330 domain-containing protein [Streptomyces roseoverticillatus]